jgi:phage baseplate assembly protein W
MSIKLTDGFDFSYDKTTKRMEILTGLDNDVQNIVIILSTFEGANKFYPTFGTKVQEIIGRNASNNYIKYIIKQAILKDSRYESVTNVSITRNPDYTANVTADVKLKDSDIEITVSGVLVG